MSKILIILHQEHSTPGRVGRLLREQGASLDIRRPALGDPLPGTLAAHDGAIIFGGPMSANDPDDYIKREIDWLDVPLREGKPYLGICLGAQMLAKNLGHRVYKLPEGPVEIGYCPIQPEPAAEALCDAPFPRQVYQWHREGFDLPAGSELLATGCAHYPVQAFRHGRNAFGFQFHPEVTYAMMCRWTVRAADRMIAPGARTRAEHLEGWHVNDAPVGAWIGSFLAAWRKGEVSASQPQLASTSAQNTWYLVPGA